MFDRLARGPVRAAARSSRGLLADEAERALDGLLASTAPETLGQLVVEHHVLERVASRMVETALAEGSDSELRRLLDGAGQAPASGAAAGELERLMDAAVRQTLQSPTFKRALREVLSSPEIRTALQSQATGFGGEMADATRRRSRALDDRLEVRVRRLLRLRPAEGSTAFGGMISRGVALVLDAALAQLVFAVVSASIALVAALASNVRPGWLAGSLAGGGWMLVTAAYFAVFWSTTGQTPGMRLMNVRVVTRAGMPPSLGRSLVRFVGLILAIVPLFAGFLPVLFDSRRRGLQDFVAGTVVLQAGSEGSSHKPFSA